MNELAQFGQLLIQLKQTSGTKARKELFKAAVQNVNTKLAKLWDWCLNPMITFGISDIPKEDPWPGDPTRVSSLNDLLHNLQHRLVTGHQAQSLVYKFFYGLPNDESRKGMRAIIRRRPDCGLGLKSINTVFPGFLPEFQIAKAKEWNYTKVEKILADHGSVLVEPKFDGERRILTLTKDKAPTFFTSSGLVDTNWPELTDLLASIFPPGTVLDGELWPLDNDFNRLASIVKQDRKFTLEEANLAFITFDILTTFEWFGQTSNLPQWQRSLWIEKILEFHVFSLTSQYVQRARYTCVNSMDDVESLFFHFLNEGLEGIIIKHPGGFYSFKRSFNWIKQKAEETVDLVIETVHPGDPDTQFEHSLGRISCWYGEHGNRVLVRVAPGRMGHALRQEMWDNRDEFIGRTIEVLYQQETADGSLRHPRFFRFRPDKD